MSVEGYVWLPGVTDATSIRIGLYIDNLSVLLLVLVSFLCRMTFVCSLGYMHEEEGKPRYYAEVSLFAAGMLSAVSADNFLQLRISWEIMGLCLYLLTCFWYNRPEAAKAHDLPPWEKVACGVLVPLIFAVGLLRFTFVGFMEGSVRSALHWFFGSP